VLAIVWLFVNRKAFLLITVPIVLVAVVYFPVFWNNNGVLGQPARAVRSLYDPSNRDASSDEYRQLEKINVRFAILSEPVTSLGFGRPFPFIVPLPDLSWWPFWHYEPHHNILWIWMKTGIGGFIAFWTLMGMSIARAANTIRAAPTREVRHFGVVCMVAVVTTLVFSYVDLGFVNPRLTLLLGVVMGALGVTRSAEALVAARENSAADVAADTATARPMTGPRRAGRLRGGARSVQPRPSEA
jgi:O-antigen ligase